jgi:transposase-like protein
MSNSNVNAAKGRRYTTKEKAEIIAFVDKVNSEKGRGGQSAASKKFKISPLTISSWIRSGIGGGTVSSAGGAAAVAGPIGKKLSKLQALHDQIARAEKELSKLKAQFNSLKAAL